ncbi:MAG TPA: tetratricopeptide repeat protein [Sphingomicrobium sp.]|jgi:cytochrome c-type biogenesis protein CcmH
MGWITLLLLVGASLGALRLLGVTGAAFMASAAVLFLGAAGYAVQGNPGVPGAPAQQSESRDVLPLTQARHAFFGDFAPAEPWLRMSEALARDGQTQDSIGILENAVKRYPGDAELWIGLGNALVDHARGLTPPAELAYRRAAEVAPGHPAAPFFYGLALARSGDRDEALKLWKDVLSKAPPDASWRPLVEQGVAALSSPPARRD